MKITKVQVKLLEDSQKLLAVASVVFDDVFVVHGVKVLEGETGLFIAMPSRKLPNGQFKDVAHPLNSETREVLIKKLIAAYEEEVKNPHTSSADKED